MITRYDGTNYHIPTPLGGVAMRALKQLTSIYYGQIQHPSLSIYISALVICVQLGI